MDWREEVAQAARARPDTPLADNMTPRLTAYGNLNWTFMERAAKPDIWFHHGYWYCSWDCGQGYVGVGASPMEAYWDWRKWHKLS